LNPAFSVKVNVKITPNGFFLLILTENRGFSPRFIYERRSLSSKKDFKDFKDFDFKAFSM